MQFRFDSLDNLLRRSSQIDRYYVLVRVWFFQVIELTLQQVRIHKMPAAAAQSLFDECIVTAKEHKLYFKADAQTIAVSTF